MKKSTFIFSVLIAGLFFSCEGPAGPAGPQGVPGATGATGAQGPAGVSTTAKYYDFSTSWDGSSAFPIADYTVPNFDGSKQYMLLYIVSNEIIFHQVPYFGAAYESNGTVGNIVNMDYYYGINGRIVIQEQRYSNNGPSVYKFRAVVLNYEKGSRVKLDVSYEKLKKMYNLPD